MILRNPFSQVNPSADYQRYFLGISTAWLRGRRAALPSKHSSLGYVNVAVMECWCDLRYRNRVSIGMRKVYLMFLCIASTELGPFRSDRKSSLNALLASCDPRRATNRRVTHRTLTAIGFPDVRVRRGLRSKRKQAQDWLSRVKFLGSQPQVSSGMQLRSRGGCADSAHPPQILPWPESGLTPNLGLLAATDCQKARLAA